MNLHFLNLKKKKQHVAALMVSMVTLSVSGQAIQREVSYTTSTSKSYTVPCDATMEGLSAYDSTYLKASEPLLRQAKQVVENGWLTIINAYPQHPYYDPCYGFQIGKSVTNKWGTTLYDIHNEVYSNLENEAVNESFAILAAEIASYGVFNNLFTSIDVACAQLEFNAIPYQRLGQKLLFISDDDDDFRVETEMDFELLYVEKRMFRGEVQEFTERTTFLQQNGWIVPTQSKKVYNDELPCGIPYQITQTETYLSYKVVGVNGNVIVNVENTIPTISLMVTLNDTKTLAFVHFSAPIDGTVHAKIVNAANEVVLEQELHVVGSLLTLDISGLEVGTYTLICTHENAEAQANFMIEDATNPNTTNIQIVPNPAQNNITVVFPTDVNTSLSVSIADMTGTVRFNQDMFVTGNTLSIDIPFLTAGMYTIYFTNSNGTISAKFMKQ